MSEAKTELKLIVWTSESCGACHALKKAKTCEKLAETHPEVELEYRDVDADSDGADDYEVSAMPSLFFEDLDGFVISEHVGSLSAAQLAKLYQKAKAKLDDKEDKDEEGEPAKESSG